MLIFPKIDKTGNINFTFKNLSDKMYKNAQIGRYYNVLIILNIEKAQNKYSAYIFMA